MPRFFMTTYPWDLEGDALGATLEKLRGEVGVTGLSVWTASGPVTELRTRRMDPRIFRTGGGVHFRPGLERFDQLRIRPVVSDWVDSGGRLEILARICLEQALDLRVRVSAARTGQLAERYPDFAVRNAFGAVSRDSLCLIDPRVEAYQCEFVAEMSAKFPRAAVILTDFDLAWSDTLDDGLETARPLGSTERDLLAVCFCDSCGEQARDCGADGDEARSRVQRVLDRAQEEGVPAGESFQAFLADQPVIARYLRFQADRLNAVLRKLAQTCNGELLLERSCPNIEAHNIGGIDVSIPDAIITRIDNASQLDSAIIPGARRNELQVPVELATGSLGPELVTTLSRAVTLGFRDINIDHFGLTSDGALTSIKQAIRFARRTASTE